jgi:hypothetical protein
MLSIKAPPSELDREAARRLKAEVEREQALGRDWTPASTGSGGGPPTLAAVVAAYLEDAGRRLKPGTVARKRAVLGVLLGFLSADRPALASDLSRTARPSRPTSRGPICTAGTRA